MTQNQIAYWSLQEQKRSNQEQERLKQEDLMNQLKKTQIEQQKADYLSDLQAAQTDVAEAELARRKYDVLGERLAYAGGGLATPFLRKIDIGKLFGGK